MSAANFARLDVSRPEVSRLVTAMLQARQAVVQRSWSHPQEDSSDDWWADVLADPRARRQTRGSHSRGAINIYRLRDEPRATDRNFRPGHGVQERAGRNEEETD